LSCYYLLTAGQRIVARQWYLKDLKFLETIIMQKNIPVIQFCKTGLCK